MSAMASAVFKDLVAQGVDESRARAFAHHLDAEAAGILAQARRHADQAVAVSEEKSNAKYVGKDEYHARDRTLATRDEMLTGFAETRGDFAELRKDFRFLAGIFVAFLAPVFAAAVKFLFFT